DFRQPDALADALLHPLDRPFTVPQIYAWLDRCGLTLGRWVEQAPYLPHCGALARTPHAGRLGELPERAQHAAAELFRGTISQHNFVAYRSYRPTPSQAIRVDGGSWCDYVPIRLPWNKCIRDHVPLGAAAVLLNPAHKHRDLVLAIDQPQYQLFSEIDGKRKLGEIAGKSGRQESSTLDF